jgi:RING finger protein 121
VHTHVVNGKVIEHEVHADGGLVFLMLIALIVVAQAVIFWWKKKHQRSFLFVTLLGVWLIPFGFSVYAGFYRFLAIWAVFSAYTLHIVKLASAAKLHPRTPRKVYGWFNFVHSGGYAVCVAGYVAVIAEYFIFVGVGQNKTVGLGMLMMFYGLYYGVLGRDCAEWSADSMAKSIGYTSSKGGLPGRALQDNICAICDCDLVPGASDSSLANRFNDTYVDANSKSAKAKAATAEKVFKLDCGHRFHDFCIRGWCLVGKKETCPYCKEKVRLKQITQGSFNKYVVHWGSALDWLRYLIVFNPVLMVAMKVLTKYFGLNHTAGD